MLRPFEEAATYVQLENQPSASLCDPVCAPPDVQTGIDEFVIGITPQGSISFISLGYGGCVSDKHITENCTFLSHILPGDIIMADRRFVISDTLGSVWAEIRISAFTQVKNQLSPSDVESTRKLASNRIHVEPVIGILRQKYTILNSAVSTELLLAVSTELLLRKEGEDMTKLKRLWESVVHQL